MLKKRASVKKKGKKTKRAGVKKRSSLKKKSRCNNTRRISVKKGGNDKKRKGDKYNTENKKDDEDKIKKKRKKDEIECLVCLKNLNGKTITCTTCNNTFCTTCIDKWCKIGNGLCPICRSILPKCIENKIQFIEDIKQLENNDKDFTIDFEIDGKNISENKEILKHFNAFIQHLYIEYAFNENVLALLKKSGFLDDDDDEN